MPKGLTKILLILLSAVAVGLVFGSRPLFHTNNGAKASFRDISPAEFDEILNRSDPFVVDVHIPEQEHLPGTDAFIPYNEIADRQNELPQNKDTEILVYCRSGSMSREAVQVLVNAGYTNVKNLSGGLQSYRESHQKIEITPLSQNLGTVVYGEIAKTGFTFVNNTAAPVEVTSLSTSCSCTKAQMEKTKLNSYESTTINVSFDPAVHKDDSDLGEVERTIYISTNNPNFRKLTASIQATVVKR